MRSGSYRKYKSICKNKLLPFLQDHYLTALKCLALLKFGVFRAKTNKHSIEIYSVRLKISYFTALYESWMGHEKKTELSEGSHSSEYRKLVHDFNTNT